MRTALEQRLEPEQLRRSRRSSHVAARGARASLAVAQVSAHAADAGTGARPGRHSRPLAARARTSIRRGCRAAPRRHLDAPGLGPQQPRDHVDERGLARARAPNKRDHARRRRFECDVEREVAARACTLDARASAPHPPAHRARERLRASSPDRPSENEIVGEPRREGIATGCLQAVYSASGSVRVSPGMLETNVMTAPNSPSPAAKAVTAPARIPGSHQRQRDRAEPVAAARRRACAPRPRGPDRRARARAESRAP